MTATRLARARWRVPVVLAGNADVTAELTALLAAAKVPVTAAGNVLPRIGVLAPGPARTAIRQVFLRHVIGGKRLSRGPRFAALVRAATPDAVLTGVEVLADTLGGDLAVVDVGGATLLVNAFGVPGRLSRAPERAVPFGGDALRRQHLPGAFDWYLVAAVPCALAGVGWSLLVAKAGIAIARSCHGRSSVTVKVKVSSPSCGAGAALAPAGGAPQSTLSGSGCSPVVVVPGSSVVVVRSGAPVVGTSVSLSPPVVGVSVMVDGSGVGLVVGVSPLPPASSSPPQAIGSSRMLGINSARRPDASEPWPPHATAEWGPRGGS